MRESTKRHLATALFASAAVSLSACGGGSGSPAPAPAPAPPQAPVAVIEGTVAAGAPVVGAEVQVKDKNGANACTEASVTSGASGAYTCTLTSGAEPPFAILAIDPARLRAPMASVATSAPTVGQTATVNVSPLTTGILGQLAADGSPFTLVGSPAAYGAVSASQLQTYSAPVVEQISVLLAAAGWSTQQIADFDPFTTPFAADRTGVDAVLDQIRVDFANEPVNGKLVSTIVNVTDPNSMPVPLAAPDTSVVPLAAFAASYAASDLDYLRDRLNGCFAVPVAQRVVAKDDTVPVHLGGRIVTEVDPACEDVAHDNFLTNGYQAGQYFYSALNDPNMDAAQFNVPEVMRVLPSDADGNPRVLLNLKFTDKNGFAGNFILVMKKFPGSGAPLGRMSDWWLWGNQRPIDARLTAFIQWNDVVGRSFGSPVSDYTVGLGVFVTRVGPGSQDSSGNLLRAVRVKGAGLPQNGLVLARPHPTIINDQTWLYAHNKDGNIMITTANVTSLNFKIRRGVNDGSVLLNPNEGNANRTQFPDWAHQLDYADGKFPPFSALTAWQVYSFELFYGTETSPSVTFNTLNVTPVLAPTIGPALAWNPPTDAMLEYLDPTHAKAAATPCFDLSWGQSPIAETVSFVGAFTRNNNVFVNRTVTRVAARGDTSLRVLAPGNADCSGPNQYPALTADGLSSRVFIIGYSMLDGSAKEHRLQYF
jgi:hypothetical protein